VVFPRYPGFITLPSGVQVRDLCVGEGAEVVVEDNKRVVVTIEWGLWTVHQGRVVTPLLPQPTSKAANAANTAAANAATNAAANAADAADDAAINLPERMRFALGDGSVIPALNEAVAVGGLRVGGVRRVLVPPKASVSYPYVPIPEVGEGGVLYMLRVLTSRWVTATFC
jgi:hypothetical protein